MEKTGSWRSRTAWVSESRARLSMPSCSGVDVPKLSQKSAGRRLTAEAAARAAGGAGAGVQLERATAAITHPQVETFEGHMAKRRPRGVGGVNAATREQLVDSSSGACARARRRARAGGKEPADFGGRRGAVAPLDAQLL